MESQPKNGTWAWIWKLRVPHKIQLFIWKCAHHRIPTKSILFSHSANFSQLCPGCHETKTPMHVLRDCALRKIFGCRMGSRLSCQIFSHSLYSIGVKPTCLFLAYLLTYLGARFLPSLFGRFGYDVTLLFFMGGLLLRSLEAKCSFTCNRIFFP